MSQKEKASAILLTEMIAQYFHEKYGFCKEDSLICAGLVITFRPEILEAFTSMITGTN